MKIVVKRSGEKVDYDSSKIKKSIHLATDGLNVNHLELEQKIDLFIKSGMRTSDIQKNVIQHAVQLASASAPIWLNVAGRALAMDHWADFKFRGKSFADIVQANIKSGIYSKELEQSYSKTDLDILGSVIDMNRDLDHSYASLSTGYKKYISKNELNQHMHMVNAMRFGQYENAESRVQFSSDFYDVLSKRELSLATPFMSNLRKGGNVASCFILAINDDLDSIFDNIKNIAKISKNGGGLGIYLGKLRAKGSSVNGYSNAAGTIARWVKIINDTLVAVNQGGLRQGAGTVALPIWHNDISDFLDMQTEHGDIRLKSYDVFPQVCVPDLFMRRDKEMGDWTTFCPFEVKNVLGIEMYGLYGDAFESAYLKIEEAASAGKLKITKTVKARDLVKMLMRPMFETGLPYVAFIDEINRQNPNKHEGYIPCVNLCTESFSNVVPDELTHVCNLASINLGNIRDMEHLAHVAKLATKALDYGISLTNNPLPSTLAHNSRYRTIGIGMMGLHDFLAKNFTSFNDLDLIRDIAECIEYNAAVQSVELQKLYGPFDAFIGSTWHTGERTREFAKHSKDPSKWHQLQLEIDKHGIRNSQLTSPAPTTSTSIYQDASATFLPVYSAFFSEDNSTGSVKVASKYLALNPLGYGKTQTKFQPNEIVAIAAEIQKFTDTGLSMELVFDQNRIGFKAKDLYDTIHYAHQRKLKSIYYIRSLKNNASISTESACVACSG